MSYNLFLDDIRTPGSTASYSPVADKDLYLKLDWKIVRNYDEFVNLITLKGLPSLISFDHDLAEAHYDPSTWKENFSYLEKTGYDCAKWLITYCMDNNLKLPEFKVHSMNPVGKENIKQLLFNFKNQQNG